MQNRPIGYLAWGCVGVVISYWLGADPETYIMTGLAVFAGFYIWENT